jgi:hypothetical protein
MSGVAHKSAQLTELENLAQAEWRNSSKLRAEFSDNFSTYLAYKKADAKGLVKVHSSKTVSSDQLGD